MKYFVTIDAEGRRTGAYRKGRQDIPEGAIEIDKPTFQEWVANDLTRRWNVETGKLEPCDPPDAAPAPPKTQFSPLEFFDLFAEAEEEAIFAARPSSPQVDRWLTRAAAARYIDVTDPRTVSGISFLVTGGLLNQARADEILAGVPQTLDLTTAKTPDELKAIWPTEIG